jgi:hypothetical protein
MIFESDDQVLRSNTAHSKDGRCQKSTNPHRKGERWNLGMAVSRNEQVICSGKDNRSGLSLLDFVAESERKTTSTPRKDNGIIFEILETSKVDLLCSF